MALLFFLRLVVPHEDHCTAGYTRCKKNQSSMGVNGESLGEFLEIVALSVLPAHADTNLHEDALTAAPSASVHRGMRDFSHATSLLINYTRRKEIVERIPRGRIQLQNLVL